MQHVYERISIIGVWLLVALAAPLTAQWRSASMAGSTPMPSVLDPQPRDYWIGFEAGVNINMHSGDFVTPVCDCFFADGDGKGVLAGVEGGVFLTKRLALALKVTYHDMRAEYSHKYFKPTTIMPDNIVVPLEYENKNDLRLAYVTVNPVIQVYPLKRLYIFAGPAVGIRAGHSYKYTKRLIDENYVFAANQTPVIDVNDDSGELPDMKSLRVDLRAGIGCNLVLGRQVWFSPEVSYNYAITTISNDDNWYANAIHIAGVLKVLF
jgi:hypothetical protein